MMFVDLHRSFVRIAKDQEPSLEVGRVWGRKIGGWLGWAELLEHRRVVLLAEASSGKSAEFRHQADKLRDEGQPAFFVTIEELADQGFETALEPASIQAFEQWRAGSGEGWFFLDSIDEARLNRKSFESALKRFSRALGPAMERARVFVSCRVSDWKGPEDRGFIERYLPAWERPKEPELAANPLLDPIFKEREQSQTRTSRDLERKPNELLVVQLVPLDFDQCRILTAHLGVPDVDAFITGINQNGLEAFAERPGDVIDLADYWKTYGRFGPFAEMVEHGINRKLSEVASHRPDNDALTPQKAREGAERLAAGLTFCKSFTLRAPGHDLDQSLAGGALDPAAILDDWTEAKCNAILRRGTFAPATYGRIRFHHRSTQEYLTARWLDGLLQANGPREEIWNLVFVGRYGVDTVVPSLRPTSAWLALWHPDFRDEIISREPLVLIRHGDPGSLPIEDRARLLATYAAKQARGEISDDSLDRRAVWMFADTRLADAIHAAWAANDGADFRFDLLRFIREGAITACADLAAEVALTRSAGQYFRIVAIDALVQCKDVSSLSAAVQDLTEDADNLPPQLAVEAAKILYPQYMTLEQLFLLIEHVRPPKQFSAEGFGHAVVELFEGTLGADQRREFISRLSDLCLGQPFVAWYQRIAQRYVELAKHIAPIARTCVQELGDHEPPPHLVRLLMAVERAERGNAHDPDLPGPSLAELVRGKPKVQHALFWEDVKEQRVHGGRHNNPTSYWQITTHGESLWCLSEDDLPWLFEGLRERPAEADQRIVLSGIIAILNNAGRLDTELPRLRDLIAGRPHLETDLANYLAPPPPPSEETQRHEQLLAENQRRHAEQEARDKESWIQFERALRENPYQLCDPQKLESWKAGAHRLWSLTRWLMHRADASDETAPLQWRLLEEAFGRDVAEAYRDGLKIHWRVTRPERPKRGEGRSITYKYPNILAFGGVGVEAREDPEWTSRLSDDEARIAALHGCLTEQGYPEWLDALVSSHPRIVLPVIRRALRDEFISGKLGRSDFLHRYGRGSQTIHPAVQKILFDLVAAKEPGNLDKFHCMLGVVERIALDAKQRKKLLKIAKDRLEVHRAAERISEARWYLAMLLVLDFTVGLTHLENWLTEVPAEQVKEHAEQTFAFLFDRNNPTIPTVMPSAAVESLEKLLRLVFAHIRPEADAYHESSYSPNTRDHAENARSSILSALLDRPGPDAYHALRRVAHDPALALRASRFQELARGKAERDAELPPWTPKEVLVFERERIAPVKTGADLLRLVEGILKDIQFQLDKGDASPRRLLQRAQDEDEVQNWLVDQMNLRARGRYRAFREAEVALGDKPDVIVASTSAPCEVAIEIKHSKNWTLRQLDVALRSQLAEDYLKPASRRHGVLLISHHLARRWRDAETNEPITFDGLIRRLSAVATTLTHNTAGAIEVRCIGIDSSDPLPTG